MEDTQQTQVSTTVPIEDKNNLNGLRGWLILICVGLFLTIVVQAYNLSIYFDEFKYIDLVNEIKYYLPFLYFQIAFAVGFIVYSIILLVFFFQKNRLFPKHYFYLLIFSLAYSIIVDTYFSNIADSVEEAKAYLAPVLEASSRDLGAAIIAILIWGSYIKRSKRVKQTFINPVVSIHDDSKSITDSAEISEGEKYGRKRDKVLACIFIVALLASLSYIGEVTGKRTFDAAHFEKIFELLMSSVLIYFIVQLFRAKADYTKLLLVVLTYSFGAIIFDIYLSKWSDLAFEVAFAAYLAFYITKRPSKLNHRIASIGLVVLIVLAIALPDSNNDANQNKVLDQSPQQAAILSPNHMSDIGFALKEEYEMSNMISSVIATGNSYKVDEGTYYQLADRSGLELWVGRKNVFAEPGLNPFFNGQSNIKLKLQEYSPNINANWLEGLLTGMVMNSSGQEKYQLYFDAPNFFMIKDRNIGRIVNVKVSAFAEEMYLFSTLKEFLDYQKSEELDMAARSFIPNGSFSDNPEEVTSHALISGQILLFEKKINTITGNEYYWFLIDGLSGSFDIVADPQFVKIEPIAGGYIFGQFWLSGKVLEE